MSIFLLIVISIPTLSLLWWWWTDRRIRRHARTRWQTSLRWLLACFVLAHLAAYVWLFATRLANLEITPPVPVLATTYIWHMVTLPILLLASLALLALDAVRHLASRKPHQPTDVPAPAQATPALSRREALATAALVAAPIALHTGLTTRGLTQLDAFRIRRLSITLPTLPPALDGFTIAHVSDTHVGRFTNGRTLDAIVRAVNDLRADVAVLTGDLIDFDLKDLPNAVAMVRQFEARHAVALCEGNHDLFESRQGFEEGCKNAGLNLLINDSLRITHNNVDVELLGLRWGPTDVDNIRTSRARGPMYAEHTTLLAERRLPTAFPILLAHHPHAFDTAAAHDIPLTLAGHTHGGQFRLAERYGMGEVMFKYVSGLYTRATPTGTTAACVVSNGTGNWFPLRINTPAEIIHITLRRKA